MATKIPTFAEAQASVGNCRVELDCCEPSDEVFQKYLQENGIQMNVLQLNGPAGGIPLVEFFGTHQALTDMIHSQFYDGSGDLSYMTDRITDPRA